MSPARLSFRSPSRARVPEGARWLYLGQDPEARGRLAARLGSPPLALGGRLRRAADRLRAPFLDMVAELGRSRRDQAGWWAGTLPWKSWDASDLFLLSCYLAVCVELAGASDDRAEPLVVVVEDPWLLRQAREALGRTSGVSFEPPPALWPRKVRAAALGAARRLRWGTRMLLSASRLAALARGRRRAPLGGGAVLVYAYLQARTFAGPGWEDVFFPGLESELARAGARMTRCADPDATGFERELTERSELAVPLLGFASPRGFLRALTALPPRLPDGCVLDGLPVDVLIRREWWHDLSRAGRCAFLLLWDAARGLLAAGSWRALVLAWEGQPQERLLALAAREAGVRVVGSQHTTVSPDQLPFFLGRGEAAWAPWPDALLTAGPRPAALLAAGGVPRERLAAGGSRRYRAPDPSAPRPAAASGEVLIVLPLDPLRSRHLLAAAARAYPRGGEGFSFAVKPHPGNLAALGEFPFPVRVDARPLEQAVSAAEIVLFTSTAAGLEALLLGRPALRYRPDALLDVDPCDVLADDVLPTAGDADLREKLEELRRRPRAPSPETVRRAFDELFSPLAPEVWRKAILG